MVRLTLVVRPISYMFRKNWYSLYRWKNPPEIEGEIAHLVDFGSFTFGYWEKA